MSEIFEVIETPKKKPASRQKVIVPSPISGFPPPVEHQFKPGQSGNPSGRSRAVQLAYQEALNEPCEIEERVLEDGKIVTRTRIGTVKEKIARRMAQEASSAYGLGKAAAQLAAGESLRKVVEPTNEEQGAGMGQSLTIALSVVRSIAIQAAASGKRDTEL